MKKHVLFLLGILTQQIILSMDLYDKNGIPKTFIPHDPQNPRFTIGILIHYCSRIVKINQESDGFTVYANQPTQTKKLLPPTCQKFETKKEAEEYAKKYLENS